MAALSRRTIQIVVGVMPAAPWTRSRRASSRSEVWSSHFANAVSCTVPDGSAAWIVRKSAAPRVEGHPGRPPSAATLPTTERA